tara:strand:+ start:4381 stop:4530 length:150 start_codon:yes stop_codon:yes gene_type:complete
MRDPTIKVVLSGSDADGNEITLSLDVPENQVEQAHATLAKLLSTLNNKE